MNTLVVTEEKSPFTSAKLKKVLPDPHTGWNFSFQPPNEVESPQSSPDLIVVPVAESGREVVIQTKIHQAAKLHNQLPNHPFVMFVVTTVSRDKGKYKLVKMPAKFIGAFETHLPSFQKPDRIDITTIHPEADLGLKFRLIDAKLKASPRKSPLDEVKTIVDATADLRSESGNLSATKVAEVFGISVSKLADALGRTRQALSKTPDANSLQDGLGFYERVARLRAVVPGDRFKKWLKMPNAELDGDKPLDVIMAGEGQVVADLVDDMLTGAPA